jgi:hypothetical protein
VKTVNAWLKAHDFAPALKLNGTTLETFRHLLTLADRKAESLTAEDFYALMSGDLSHGTRTADCSSRFDPA